VPAGNVITLAAIEQPVISFITVVFRVRLTNDPVVFVPPFVPAACVSLKIAVGAPPAANEKLALSEDAVRTSPAVYVVKGMDLV
jgi:hypothetical protein